MNMILEEICRMTEQEINELVDTGIFNSVIKGYVLLLQDNKDISLSELFDTFSAEGARNRYIKGAKFMNKNTVVFFDIAVKKVNSFLKSSTYKLEMNFIDGFFLYLKKHKKGSEYFMEIHTSGYDDTLPAVEAVDWIKWELINRRANGILK